MARHDDEQALRRMARTAMHTGFLPSRAPERIWGGKGSGSRCAVCARVIDAFETEFELDFGSEDAAQRKGGSQMHSQCFVIWECERAVFR